MPRVVHFELPADDPERAVKFYEKAFGWNLMKWDGPMEYWLVSTGDAEAPGIDGGLSRRRFPGEGMSLTVDVESVDASVADEPDAVSGMGEAGMIVWPASCRDAVWHRRCR